MEQNEAYALMAGVGGELSFVTVRGDKTHEGSDRSPPTRDLVAASSFGVQGRKRMPRQRRSSAINLLTFAPSTSPHVPPPPPARVSFLFLSSLPSKFLVLSLKRKPLDFPFFYCNDYPYLGFHVFWLHIWVLQVIGVRWVYWICVSVHIIFWDFSFIFN